MKTEEPPDHLLRTVILRLRLEESLIKARRAFAGFCGSLLASAVAIFFVGKLCVQGLIHSGFLPFVTLIFSDSGLIAQNWQAYGYALLEALPVTLLLLLLSVLLLFVYSLAHLSTEAKRVL